MSFPPRPRGQESFFQTQKSALFCRDQSLLSGLNLITFFPILLYLSPSQFIFFLGPCFLFCPSVASFHQSIVYSFHSHPLRFHFPFSQCHSYPIVFHVHSVFLSISSDIIPTIPSSFHSHPFSLYFPAFVQIPFYFFSLRSLSPLSFFCHLFSLCAPPSRLHFFILSVRLILFSCSCF